jgi:outer membrane protein assembly factor BamB
MKEIIIVSCILVFFLMASTIIEPVFAKNDLDFTLPDKGCYMAHCDPCQTDNNLMPIPEENVSVVWYHRELIGEIIGTVGIGFSGNKEIAACTFSGVYDNLVVYDYDGSRLWKSGDLLNALAGSSAPMIDVYGRIIACDNKVVIMVDPLDVDSDGKIVEWITELPGGGIPFSPVLTENGTVIIATDRGPIYAVDSNTGSLLATKYLIPEKPVLTLLRLFGFNDSGFYSTINTPCTKGNRVYISTHFKDLSGWFGLFFDARLYAIDVDSDNPNPDERLQVAWHRGFGGPSGASPTLINDTIYFDGDRGEPSLMIRPHIYAVQDMGTYGKLKWKTPMPTSIDANMASDPRGGLWVVDTYLGRLVRYSIETGKVIERININDLVQEPGLHTPSSVITISGNETRPILLVSATAIRLFKSNSYIIAIDLVDNNSLLWKLKIAEATFANLQIPLGQYPVLMKNGEPRIVFATTRGGVWALGET